MRSIWRGFFVVPRDFSGSANTDSCGFGSLTAAIAAAIAGGIKEGTYLLDFFAGPVEREAIDKAMNRRAIHTSKDTDEQRWSKLGLL